MVLSFAVRILDPTLVASSLNIRNEDPRAVDEADNEKTGRSAFLGFERLVALESSSLVELYRDVDTVLGHEGVMELLSAAFAYNLGSGNLALAKELLELDPTVASSDDVARLRNELGQRDDGLNQLRTKKAEINKQQQPVQYAGICRRIGHLEKGSGRWQASVETLRESLTIYQDLSDHGNAIGVLVEIGNSFIDGSKFDEAKQCFAQALEYYSKDPQDALMFGRLYNNIGFLMDRQRFYERALYYYHRAIETLDGESDPAMILAHVNIAELSIRIGDDQAAILWFGRVLELTQNHDQIPPEALRWRTGAAANMALLKAASSLWKDALPNLLHAAELMLRTQDHDLMRLFMTQILEFATHDTGRNLTSDVATCIQSGAELGISGSTLCITYFQCALELETGSLDLVLDMLSDIRDAGDSKDALLICDKLLEGEPQNSRAHMGRGLSLSDMGLWADADKEYNWFIDRHPDNPVPWNNKAADSFRREDPEAAIDLAARAISLNPRYAEPWEIKTLAHIARGELAEAASSLRHYVELAPQSPRVVAYRRMLLMIEIQSLDYAGPDGSGQVLGPVDYPM